VNRLVVEAGLIEALTRINTLRHADPTDGWAACLDVAEELIESLFTPSHHLAVYGSLAPGQSNHYMVAHLPGQWLEGFVHGTLYDRGWGAGFGFPGLIWEPEGPKIEIHLFVSPQLPQHWALLDAFEGAEYQRNLVPVYDAQGIIAVANIYELRR
jgi:gamma-glutamylcyclotransferase (GGCT)/AIG2-like uncharacterized protein YtfP